MDIKIRARLSAYSKISSVDGINTQLPLVGEGDVGAVLGVGETGTYTLFPTVSKDKVDEMFIDTQGPSSVEKEEIDTLFEEEKETTSVTKEEIDSLFEDADKPESVDKDDIDTLFKERETSIGTVSFADIDSLFK